jgi:hypothetical protein
MNRRFRRRALLGLTIPALTAACGLVGHAHFVSQIAARRPAAAGPQGPPRLTYVSGSTTKLEQVIGDYDKGFKTATLNQTESRYGIIGTDLGSSFEHEGKVYFLFGDTIGPGALKPVGYSESSDPNEPLRFDFLSGSPGTFIPLQIPGVSMGPFEVPVTGLSLEGAAYVVVSTNYSPKTPTDRSVLTRFDEQSRSFSTVREVSRLPEGHFIKMTLRVAPPDLVGLPSPEPHILIFGSGAYRRSNAYLAAVPVKSFTSGEQTRYFAGMDGDRPMWSDMEADAVPIVTHPVIGDISVVFLEALGLWLMTYDSRVPQGIILRYAEQPWGPWSDAVVIFNPRTDAGVGAFLHNPRLRPDDGVGGPVIGGRDPSRVAGGAYAPYMIERFIRVQGGRLELQYLLSTWNPYTVVRMRSTLSIAR